MLDRRLFLVATAALAACGRTTATRADEQTSATASTGEGGTVPWGAESIDYSQLTDTDWRARLTAEQFRILRQEGTERAGSSPLNDEHREGLFVCAGCRLPLFSSAEKYESGTGWPSFRQPIDGAVGTKPDNTLWTPRTEYHCARCGGHQGHVFNDGPRPTGQRWCNNGVALDFVPA